MNTIINTCLEASRPLHTIAYYSHLVPFAINFFLSIFVLIKSRGNLLSRMFFYFSIVFSLWLLGDLILWTRGEYNAMVYAWSLLDFLNVLFFIFAYHFFAVLVMKHEVSVPQRLLMIALAVPAAYLTLTSQSIGYFDHAYCEATNNEYLTYYKLFVEFVCALGIFYLTFKLQDTFDKSNKIKIGIVSGSLILFFSVFSGTEFIASNTGVYEISLYGLFVLPLFVMAIVYSVTNLGIFELRLIGTQVIAYVLILLIGSQFLFLSDSSDKLLNGLTLLMSVVFGYLLVQNSKKEAMARLQIQKLAHDLSIANAQLKELDQMKSQFLSFASHQIRSPLTAIKGYSSMLLEGDYGKMPAKISEAIKIIDTSTQSLIVIVNEFLDVSRIEQGRMKYEFTDFDIRKLVEEVVAEQKPNVEKKGLTLSYTANQSATYAVHADTGKIKQVLGNVLDNAIKYTPQGSINVKVEKNINKIHVSITDSGVGLDPEDITKLFSMFSRAKDASKANVSGTGLGLYVAKQMLEAQKGKIWVESPGKGKGSTFHIEIEEK